MAQFAVNPLTLTYHRASLSNPQVGSEKACMDHGRSMNQNIRLRGYLRGRGGAPTRPIRMYAVRCEYSGQYSYSIHNRIYDHLDSPSLTPSRCNLSLSTSSLQTDFRAQLPAPRSAPVEQLVRTNRFSLRGGCATGYRATGAR
ncbi:hypothetical protein AG1IA_09893 [Rhizoctonia solani AG-1 IA]|uniref:Uncharacterized protein n=1 Tax=Thanatephorus cucumeris (strain AG1-IA) TaxID=983506 RepID=L8WH70_THACA|nr:hypothetical protein AG1IA_09893 [Rhizoctonia solani AG-1 IA]